MVDGFVAAIEQALAAASANDCLLTLGIKPSRPDTGYGYIQYVDNTLATDANGAISLALSTSDANALVIAPGITALTNYLTQNKFVYKWYYSSDFKSEYIGLQKSTDANSYFFGVYGN